MNGQWGLFPGLTPSDFFDPKLELRGGSIAVGFWEREQRRPHSARGAPRGCGGSWVALAGLGALGTSSCGLVRPRWLPGSGGGRSRVGEDAGTLPGGSGWCPHCCPCPGGCQLPFGDCGGCEGGAAFTEPLLRSCFLVSDRKQIWLRRWIRR